MVERRVEAPRQCEFESHSSHPHYGGSVTAKPKRQEYMVYAKVVVDCAIPVAATSFEDALEQARDLKVLDFVEVLGEHNDSNHQITGVYLSNL
jgi:hypothetical protein